MSLLAITGATGFVGSELLRQALAAGHIVRALTRRPQPPRAGVTWIEGALGRRHSLAELVDGADAVVHVAGVVNARDRSGFAVGNIEGTRAILEVSVGKRFVHISSLSAREPQLSDYGWSKAAAERLVEASALDWTIVRPSGVYGPGDTELRDMFRIARFGLALLPPRGRVSLVAAADLSALLLTLATQSGPKMILEVDDGHPLTHARLGQLIGAAVGRSRVLPIHLPRPFLELGARIDKLTRGSAAKLTPDRVGYLCHADWTADADRRPDPAMWTPRTPIALGLARTAAWYRAEGLL